jgi:hypothetical protein
MKTSASLPNTTIVHARHQRRMPAYLKTFAAKFNNPRIRTVVFVGARGCAKSWGTARCCLFWMIKHPRCEIIVLPGGREQQGSMIIKHVKDIAVELGLSFLLGTPYNTIAVGLVNGSIIHAVAPTEAGARGWHGDIIVYEEAQDLDIAIFDAADGTATKAGAKRIVIGTAKTGSVLHQEWARACEDERVMVKWPEAVDAGVIGMQEVMNYKARHPAATFKREFECDFSADASAFKVKTGKMKRKCRMVVIGIDPNRNPGYAWCKVGWDGTDAFILGHGVCNYIEEFKGMQCNYFALETNYTNQDTERWARQNLPNVIMDQWTAEHKEEEVENVLVACEQGHVISEDDEMTNILSMTTFKGGKMEKIKGRTDYADAFIHAAWVTFKRC